MRPPFLYVFIALFALAPASAIADGPGEDVPPPPPVPAEPSATASPSKPQPLPAALIYEQAQAEKRPPVLIWRGGFGLVGDLRTSRPAIQDYAAEFRQRYRIYGDEGKPQQPTVGHDIGLRITGVGDRAAGSYAEFGLIADPGKVIKARAQVSAVNQRASLEVGRIWGIDQLNGEHQITGGLCLESSPWGAHDEGAGVGAAYRLIKAVAPLIVIQGGVDACATKGLGKDAPMIAASVGAEAGVILGSGQHGGTKSLHFYLELVARVDVRSSVRNRKDMNDSNQDTHIDGAPSAGAAGFAILGFTMD